jgi:DNA-directed RNA polymerase specialized sigma24 family protein
MPKKSSMRIKVPKGQTEEEVIDLIREVCHNLAHKYRFGYFDVDDLEQEGFLIAVDGLYGYDGSIPLRNFLYIHIANRFKNLVRDCHYRQPSLCPDCRESGELCDRCVKKQETANLRKNIMSPTDIDSITPDNEDSVQYYTDYAANLDNKDAVELLEEHIPKDCWEDYLKFKDGLSIPTLRRQKLLETITAILSANGYHE